MTQLTTASMPIDPVEHRRGLREILRDNIARLLYDSLHLGDGLAFDDLDPALRVAWDQDARASQRLVDPIVRDALQEIIAAELAADRGLDWPRLTHLPIAADPIWSPEELQQRLELHRIETRQRYRRMARVCLTAVMRHLRHGGNEKYPHLDQDVVTRAQAQMAEDEIQRMVLRPKPSLRGIDGGRS